MDEKRTIADAIKSARRRLRLTQRGAARAWGVNVRSLQRWERGANTPNGTEMLKLAPVILAKN